MEVLPSVEVVSSGEVLPSVELVMPTAAVPRVAVPPSIEVLTEEVPSVGVPQLTEPASGVVRASEDGGFAALENFVNNVTEDIPSPLMDKPAPRRRVDPVLRDAPPQLPSSEALGLRRSRRQALDPLSAVKPARRGAVLLMRRLDEIGVPLPVSASTEEAVDKLFREGPPLHYLDAMQDLLPMLKNKTKISPLEGWSVD
jgi:hypothetical protein